MKRKGFSAIEASLSLALFLMVLLAAFEFFGITRDLFFKLKNAQEENQTAMAALDKMRIDLLRAGAGLLEPVRQGVIEGIATEGHALVVTRSARTFSLVQDLPPGESRISLETTTDLGPGKGVCIFDGGKTEVKTVTSVEGKSIHLDTPLEGSYSKDETKLALLERTSLFLDDSKSCLRRKVNASSPQPLLDNALSFEFGYDGQGNLARVSFAVKSNLRKRKERKYELLVYPKNLSLGLKNHGQE
jgi:hypothetical protein